MKDSKKIEKEYLYIKKTYTSPCLVKFGLISKLTSGGAPSLRSDGGNNMMFP